jgi:short-subunit dehydrogenase
LPDWAVVTGASSGIGAAFARALRARSRRVVLVARRQDRLFQMAAELGGADSVATVALDLAAPGAPERLVAEIAQRGLRVDLLVNNAGVGHNGRFHEEPLAVVRGMIDLNVRALVELTHLVLPGMIAERRGGIINVVSMSAFQPIPYLAVYAATKAFVLSFTEGVAAEIDGTGVVLQALCPGNIPTEFQQVAGTSQAAYTKTPSTSAEEVVEASLRALDARRLIVIPGFQDRMTVALQGFVPRSMVRKIAGKLFRPK